MPAIPIRASFLSLKRRLPWIVYGAVLLVILGAAARMRYSIPQTPLFDGDSWGYLCPAFSKLTGGFFLHTFARNFVYPGFLFVVLCLFGNYEAIALWQHALGLLTGVVLALAWNLLCELLAVSRGTRMAARFLGLAAVADCLLSRSAVLFEHTIRPEGVFPFFVALSFALNFYALNPRNAVRRPALARWCLGVNLVVVCVAASLKPSTGFAVIAMNLPLVFWLVRRGDPWRKKLKVTGTALSVAALALWLPERQLARHDPNSTTFLPEALFAIHAKIIHQQILDDLRTGHTAPYAPAWLAAFNRQLEESLGAAERRENNPWPTIGFNADYLMFQDSVFQPFFGPGKGHDAAAFCNRYYLRTWLHRPGAMLRAAGAELGVVYLPPKYIRFALVHINDPYTGKIQRPLSYDYEGAWQSTRWLNAELHRSQYGGVYLPRLESLRHTGALAWQARWIGYLNNGMNLVRLPMLALGLLCGLALWWRRETRILAGAVWLCLLVDFSLFLTVAVVHTLDIDRYVQNQHACSVFAEFAVLLLPWQLLGRKAKGHPQTSGSQPAPSSSNTLSMLSCLALTQTLVECRYLPVYAQLNTIGQKHSMLHLDVLTLLYYFARQGEGGILEIGPYLGGSTIALALGVEAAGRDAKLTTVEKGGSLAHPTLPSEDILRDLKRNLDKRGVAKFVHLFEGRSDEPAIVKRIKEMHSPGSVGLFMIDADGGVQRDLSTYEALLSEDCLLVIDDYYAPGSPKAGPTREGVDALVAQGRAEPLGVYGWGTWIGRCVPRARAAAR